MKPDKRKGMKYARRIDREKRTETIMVRTTPSRRTFYEQEAKLSGQSLAALVEDAAFRQCVKRWSWRQSRAYKRGGGALLDAIQPGGDLGVPGLVKPL